MNPNPELAELFLLHKPTSILEIIEAQEVMKELARKGLRAAVTERFKIELSRKPFPQALRLIAPIQEVPENLQFLFEDISIRVVSRVFR